MTEDAGTLDTSVGPICPNCREPLREVLRHEQVTPKTSGVPEPLLPLTVVFCGACGWTLGVVPARPGVPDGFGSRRPGVEDVAPPQDEESLEGQFQVRCRALVSETRSLGFDPYVWVSMINSLGAIAAAKKLLADQHVLVATPWLVARGRPELTIEHEIGQTGWGELFSEEDRTTAEHRLVAAGSTPA
jgi:hypothetical protein